MPWKDTTSYSRDKPRVQSCWSLRLTSDVQISVVGEHIHHKGEWVVHCRPWYDTHPLGMRFEPGDSGNAASAQAKALELVRSKISELSAAVSAVTI